ncbi:hypothetical protein X474_13210 [Dethiosulfatarculus sandiegensis]|uniref:Uncharacterized protein n=1 Tax=Dethiosulfatarculus sandiegensis TaxID=1429043 RepID=A0A0D2GGL1_9BACT|nr:hypothetical protein X474_13210 [Dethiosulfatarculus sandiegensis]
MIGPWGCIRQPGLPKPENFLYLFIGIKIIIKIRSGIVPDRIFILWKALSKDLSNHLNTKKKLP